jgi:hypothetical protein
MMSARAFARRCGACLALAALVLQLALSFAHVHKHDLAFSGGDHTAAFAVKLVTSIQRAVEQPPSRLADDDDHCPICFSGFLLSNSSLTDGPAHPHALLSVQIDPAFNPLSDFVVQPRRAAFSSRAPPTA